METQDQSAIVLECVNLLKTSRYQESFQAVQEALLKSDWPGEIISRLHLLRGTFYLLSCREDLALDDFELVIMNDHADPLVKINAIIKRATVLLLHDNTVNVEEAFSEALKISRDCPDIYYHRGLSFEITHDRLSAIKDYRRALELLPGYSCAAVGLLLSTNDIFRLSSLTNNNAII